MLERHILSKSTFIRSLQCQKSLYLYKNFYKERDPLTEEQKAVFSRGTKVGEFAQRIFPGGLDASPASPLKYRESVALTTQLIEEGKEIIYEAAFQYEQVLVAIDILVKKNGKWYAYEVKSSTRVSQTYLNDAYLQYHVITKAGIRLEDMFILYVNNQYVRRGAVEPRKLFSKVSVKADAEKNMDWIVHKINVAKQTIFEGKMPEVPIGEHCFIPYNCDYRGTCWKNIPENSVFELSGISKEDQFKMYQQGIVRIDQVPENYSMNASVATQVKSFKEKQPVIQKDVLKEYLQALSYPLYFIDFEIFMPAIPRYDGTHAYEHIPFQYSIHYKKEQGLASTHFQFLAEPGPDPRKAFIENFLKDTDGVGYMLVYNADFERGVLNYLKRLFPEYKTAIEERLSRIKDLITPFKERMVYYPEMKGSHSIKQVLPALVPEISYDDLKIKSGNVAMAMYEQLQDETDMFNMMELQESLLEYCKMDTYAMVRILEVLEGLVADK